eukprot:4034747-Pyramimonas_sp.AAC.1
MKASTDAVAATSHPFVTIQSAIHATTGQGRGRRARGGAMDFQPFSARCTRGMLISFGSRSSRKWVTAAASFDPSGESWPSKYNSLKYSRSVSSSSGMVDTGSLAAAAQVRKRWYRAW